VCAVSVLTSNARGLQWPFLPPQAHLVCSLRSWDSAAGRIVHATCPHSRVRTQGTRRMRSRCVCAGVEEVTVSLGRGWGWKGWRRHGFAGSGHRELDMSCQRRVRRSTRNAVQLHSYWPASSCLHRCSVLTAACCLLDVFCCRTCIGALRAWFCRPRSCNCISACCGEGEDRHAGTFCTGLHCRTPFLNRSP
jgi:hypothetical protein